jgi:hypothetical protein
MRALINLSLFWSPSPCAKSGQETARFGQSDVAATDLAFAGLRIVLTGFGRTARSFNATI